MSSIPLPALDIKPPQEQAGPLQQYAQVLGIKNQMQEQQVRAQQLQAGGLENQQRQIALDQTKAANDAYHAALTVDEAGQPKIDTGKLSESLAATGHGAAIPGILKNVTDYQKAAADLQETQTKVQAAASDSLGYLGAAIQKSNYDPHLADLMIEQRLKTPGVPAPEAQRLTQIRASIQQDPTVLKGIVDQMVSQSPKQQEFASSEKVANIRANGGVENREMADWIAKNPGKGPADYQAFKVSQARESEISKETDPRVLRSKMNLQASEARIAQAIKDGSAEDAGKLMAQRLVAPSEIQARSNPSFFVKAANAAVKADPTFNPQRAEAEFAVAKSPTNVGFFGSAKSLTDKGGTLDQLETVGKEIPQHDLPALNTIDDWRKAASGDGPIAKYAATALGVADDYAKVMGGGQGSDTSREQALKLIGPNQSPQQRADAVQGIRGAVGSQQESRIGNNRVLKAMYGNQQGGGGEITVTAPDGSVHPFDTQQQADNFKKLIAGAKK